MSTPRTLVAALAMFAMLIAVAIVLDVENFPVPSKSWEAADVQR